MLALLLLGCPADPSVEDSAATTPTVTGVTGLDGTCLDAERLGRFTVDSNADYAFVTGSANDGVVPTSVLTQLYASGDCIIWRRENPYCDPACDPGDTCGLDGTCVPYPVTQDLGLVRVDGLVQAVEMSPVSPGYTYFDTSLPNPPWTPGAALSLTTGNGVWDPIQLDGVAPETLAASSLAWVVTRERPFAMAWDDLGAPVPTEVVLELRIDQHGTTPSSAVCRFVDDGAAEVPADIIDELMGLGVTGFPAGSLVRRTADRADLGDGCLDFIASSSQLPHVSISGYTPCRSDEECPKGLECNEALERCE